MPRTYVPVAERKVKPAKRSTQAIKTIYADSLAHCLLLILKSYGIGVFVTYEQIRYISPKFNDTQFTNVIRNLTKNNLVIHKKECLALTSKGDQELYLIANKRRSTRPVEEDDDALFTEELINVYQNQEEEVYA